MYELFYGLRERPFTIVPNPACLFMSAKHKLAFAHLQYGLMEGTGFVVLTGGIGTGKTTLLRFLMGKIKQAMDVALVFNTNVTGSELLRLVIREFEAGEPGQDKAANLALLNDFLIERYSRGRNCILVIDEAQNLSRETLEEVRLLSNLQGSTRPLLQVVLAGQPELRRKLADPTLTQLAQRVTSTFHLCALSPDETQGYIRFRLLQAGGDPALFDPEAVEEICRLSHGVPRLINILCDAALVHGFADDLRVIGRAAVLEAAQELAPVLQVPSAAETLLTLDESGPGGEAKVAADLAGRLRALEERLVALESGVAAWGADMRVVSQEVAVLKERALLVKNSQATPAPTAAESRPVVPAAPPPAPEIRPTPEAGPGPGLLRRIGRSLFGRGS